MDMATYKKKYRVAHEQKVFILSGGYGDLRNALLQRGWFENKNFNSNCFDLKWCLKAKEIDHSNLKEGQIVNHFAKATSITTKVGLTHSLKNLIWFKNIDVDSFYPRCFDLGMQEETDDFIEDFKATKAQSLLKIYVREIREAYDADPNGDIYSRSVEPDVLKVAQDVCMRCVRDLDDLIDDPEAFGQLVSEAEWQILSQDELNS
jgi:tubulin monoglycylase TTLL3/8